MFALHPFILVGVAISIGTLIYSAHKLSPWLNLAVFVSGTIGAVYIALTSRRRSSPARPGNKVDHDRLHKLHFLPYADWIRQNVRGHDEVVDNIVASIQDELSLARPKKVVGAYLLVGPTGTGKTFLSRLVGEALYPESETIILPMNQYKHPDDVFTLIGPPPGRPGYEVGGTLTRPVLENPYRVVVFDEIEKCHPDLRHCLYDILDTAQCREKSSNKLVDFSGCIFFATSNAGVDQIRAVFSSTADINRRSTLSRDVLADKAALDKAFLARWTRIELMDELAPISVAEVALLQVRSYWKQFDMEVSYVDPSLLLDAIARNEEFRAYGVRQLETFIRNKTARSIKKALESKLRRVRLNVTREGEIIVQAS